MKRDHALTIFEAAGFEVIYIREISNQYWPDVDAYREMRQASPWFLIKTNMGVFIMGDRKRVISIEWTLSDFPKIDGDKLTDDQVTKGVGDIHAYSIVKAIEYLTAWMSLTI